MKENMFGSFISHFGNKAQEPVLDAKDVMRNEDSGQEEITEDGADVQKEGLYIDSDVNASVGNLDVEGDVEIQGDVLSGIKIEATGNITIHGMVGNSVLIAGKDVQIGMGVRGGGEARVRAEGNVVCSYMESCEVRAGGFIRAGSMINCDAVSHSRIDSTIIIGGTLTALERISAKTIGNQQRRPVVFNLGITEEMLNEKGRLEKRLKELSASINRESGNLNFYEHKETLSEQEQTKYKELLMFMEAWKREQPAAADRLTAINAAISTCAQCELTAETIYPPATVMFRDDILLIDSEEESCRIWSEGENLHFR